MNSYRWVAAALLSLACLSASLAVASATAVGETHRVAPDALAAPRDAGHAASVRVTIWYPAAAGPFTGVSASGVPTAGAYEKPLVIGPPGRPLFDIGRVAPDAAFVDGTKRPVILLSHGFGGTARIMGWFGIAMARHGYVVIAVDHPGNNTVDAMTVPGAVLVWDRAADLRAALAQAAKDPVIGPHLDLSRIGSAGFSAGGFTALLLAGARADLSRFEAFCVAHPDDGVCRPQHEFAVTAGDRAGFFNKPENAAAATRAGADQAVPGVRAAFVMAPALVQMLTPQSLAAMHVPVTVILGDADTVAPPATNGLVAAAAISGADLIRLPGVDHYGFLAPCTPAGEAAVPVCATHVPKAATHRRAIEAALALFGRAFGPP